MRPRIAARLAESVTNRGPRQAFLPARVHAAEDGELLATPIRSAGSADIAALALSNALLIVPPGAGTVPPGRPLMVQPLLGFPDPGPGWSDPR